MRNVLFAILACATAVVSAFEFSRNGIAACQLATADNPSRLEQQAVNDLKEFLEKMTGVSFSVCEESKIKPGDTATVYVGQTDFAAVHGINFSLLAEEQWIIKTVGKSLIVSGGRPVGTFYGVWNLLNRLGCYALAMDQYAIPNAPSLEIGALDINKAPSFAGRLIYNDFPGTAMVAEMDELNQQAYKLFSLRNGTNGSQTHRMNFLYIGKLFNISHTPFHHTLLL